jgi:hypothetical protein
LLTTPGGVQFKTAVEAVIFEANNPVGTGQVEQLETVTWVVAEIAEQPLLLVTLTA